jgi:NUMOD3 motif
MAVHRRGGIEVTYDRTKRAYPLEGVMCEGCGARPAEHRHHKDKDITNISRDNIELLCKLCHCQRHPVSEETRAKISRASKCIPKESRARQAAAMIGNQHTKGYRHNAETRAKLSKAKEGNKNALGHKHSSETLAKMRGNQNALGYKHSEEARAKMRAAQQLRRKREAELK